MAFAFGHVAKEVQGRPDAHRMQLYAIFSNFLSFFLFAQWVDNSYV